MKKGQIAGQVFIYIMAVIVVGAIALIGYQAIAGIMSKSCDVEKINFRTDINAMIEKYTSYGSVNIKVIPAPCSYDTIYFIDKSDIGTGSASTFTCQNKIIEDSVTGGAEENIFAVSGQKTIGLGYSDLISLNSTYTIPSGKCLEINQSNKNFHITFSGEGATTQISAS